MRRLRLDLPEGLQTMALAYLSCLTSLFTFKLFFSYLSSLHILNCIKNLLEKRQRAFEGKLEPDSKQACILQRQAWALSPDTRLLPAGTGCQFLPRRPENILLF